MCLSEGYEENNAQESDNLFFFLNFFKNNKQFPVRDQILQGHSDMWILIQLHMTYSHVSAYSEGDLLVVTMSELEFLEIQLTYIGFVSCILVM